MKIIRAFIIRHWPVYLLGILLLILTDALSILIPFTIGQAIDAISAGNGNVAFALWRLFAISLHMAFFRFFYRDCIMGTTRRLEFALRTEIFRHALYLPMSVYDRDGPGKIMALVLNDVTSIRVAVGLGIMLLIDAGVMGLVSFVVMFRSIDPWLTLWSVVPLPFVFVATAVLGRTVHKRFRLVQENFSMLTEFSQEVFGGAKVIKAFGMEKVFAERFSTVNNANMEANLLLARIQAVYRPVTHVAPLFCYGVALWIGGNLVVAGKISIGDLAAFIGYLGLIVWPVMGLGYLINTVQRGLASLVRIQDFLSIQAYETENLSEALGRKVNGEIEFRSLSFQYPLAASPCLNSVSALIPGGSTVGIVGRTGAGKTTLLRLLLRLYPVSGGQIFIDGKDINHYSFVHLRANIGYVPQEAGLFSATIGENISFGQDYARNLIEQAAEAAAVREDIDARTEGFEAVLGEKGTRISGGQRQRVAVARALIRRPAILLLDDVFSSLDYHTQAELIENLKRSEDGNTTLIVSQRVAAVKHARFILVMEDGRIAEQGTHDELIAAEGLYFKLYEQQLASGEST